MYAHLWVLIPRTRVRAVGVTFDRTTSMILGFVGVQTGRRRTWMSGP